MKIDDSTGKLPLPPTASGRASIARAEAQVPGKPADKVSLSGSGKALANPAEPPIDVAKVAQVRAAIADGSFRVDADRIADNVISASRELLQGR